MSGAGRSIATVVVLVYTNIAIALVSFGVRETRCRAEEEREKGREEKCAWFG